MPLSYHDLRRRLSEHGLWPTGRLARSAWYLFALDLLLFLLQEVLKFFKLSWGSSLGGWVSILSFAAIVLFCMLAFRWLKTKLLWRLRNRLIVTYMFIGVIPVALLVALVLGSFYLFAGQFATFIVTTGLNSELKSLEATNSAIAHGLAARLESGKGTESAALEDLRHSGKAGAERQVSVRLNEKIILNSSAPGTLSSAPAFPDFLKNSFRDVVRDHGKLFLRTAETLPLRSGKLTVLTSEPLDQQLLEDLAKDLGEITLYASGLTVHKVDETQQNSPVSRDAATSNNAAHSTFTVRKPDGDYVLDTGKEALVPTYSAGNPPSPTGPLDRRVTFATSVFVVNWDTGDTSQPAAISVQTSLSMLYQRLFSALGEFAPAIEFGLVFVAAFFAVIELLALLIGTHLTRTVTGAVAQLYQATKHINRGDFSHRIPVRSKDQLSELANSFNSMTASIEKLIIEQKEKQRLENELVIAQEVQAQLFPKEISQLESLEVHGFCRPARTVSGDYYDFLALNSDRLILAVGDISGKGISAALLMATIHSAVRAYSLEGMPRLREPVAVGAVAGTGMMMASGLSPSGETSPAMLLALLNHQLYESTPLEKYATLFLALYDGASRKLTYSNGGHLPPVIISEDGTLRRLDCGGMVVGLFDNLSYEESSVHLQSGEIFLAYSDGVTEPENEYGEFGEERLIELVSENRHLPLTRITEAVTAAVDDWIGPHEQPDDVTLVLARAR